MPDEKTPSLRAVKKSFADALCAAARKNNASAIKLLATRALDPSWLDALDSSGATALCEAASHGNERAARALFTAGASTEAHNKRGQRPLMLSCSGADDQSRPSMVRLLLDAGAMPNARNQVRLSALHCCTFGESALHLESACLLMAYGADPNVINVNKRTPAHLASLTGNMPLIKALVQGGARLDLRDNENQDVARLAFMLGELDTAAFCSALDLARLETIEISKSIQPRSAPTKRSTRAL